MISYPNAQSAVTSCRAHTFGTALKPRAEPNRSLRLPDPRRNGVDDLQREPRAVLDGPAILILALVGDVIKELLDKVAVRAVHLDSIEPSTTDGILGGLRVPPDVLLDLCSACQPRDELGAYFGYTNRPSSVPAD